MSKDGFEKRFYSIAGSNGFGVMDQWQDVEKSKKYFIDARWKKHSVFFEAEQTAINEFMRRRLYPHKVIPEHLVLNRLVFAKNLPNKELRCFAKGIVTQEISSVQNLGGNENKKGE